MAACLASCVASLADADPKPPAELPAEAHPAWRAYQAMVQSKAAHFELLEACTRKREEGGVPSLVEELALDQRLAAHDRAVAAFKAAITALRESANTEAMQTLLRRMR